MREIDIINKEKLRILYCMPETDGDVLISTGVIKKLKEKFPNSNIYFATKKQHFGLIDGFPLIDGVIEYNDNMLNYRTFETWSMFKNLFDIVYCPFLITQRCPHWIHRGLGPYLGDAYAHVCNVSECDELWIRIDDIHRFNLPSTYITVHSQTRQDPKNYDQLQSVVDKIKNIPIVQVGGANDIKINNIAMDLRGQTTYQETAGIIQGATMHLGLDSLPMHIAYTVKTPSVILFGGTYMKQGVHPLYKKYVHGIEVEDRGPCVTSCHLIECEARKIGFDKCINNIPIEDVLFEVRKILGKEHVEPEELIKISSYIIIKDGIKYGFPFEKCIEAAAKVSDEVVVVDGGSKDETPLILSNLQNKLGINKLNILIHDWDMDNPTLFGDEKTYARQQCTGNWLIQLDADEIIQESYPGAIRDLIKKNRARSVIDLPCINFYGDDKTIRIEDNCFKWRISKNDSNIIHGVHAAARIFDPETMKITMDKSKSDGCEYITADTLQICKHKAGFNTELLKVHALFKQGRATKEQYKKVLDKIIKNECCVFHYSWFDLKRKENNGEFWNETFHGKRKQTYNTTEDIKKRVEEKKDTLMSIDFDHPMKNKEVD